MDVNGIEVTGFSIDSRLIQPGECFVAIKTQKADGHDYLLAAKERGAAVALVAQEDSGVDLPQVIVANPVEALGDLAKEHRQQLPHTQLVALTGSCGKTTTRQLLQSICQQAGQTHASVKSYNNHLGVPLTLLSATAKDRFIVQEMGANHPGEIQYLTKIARPDVAMITNAAAVHLSGFKSVAGVAQAKGEIFQGLSSKGTAVINADDDYADYWQTLIRDHRVITFGFASTADVRAEQIRVDDQGFAHFDLHIGGHKRKVSLQMLGAYNVMNALAASACAHALAIDIDTIHQGLEQAAPEMRRMRMLQAFNGARLIDDSYNANPKALRAAIDVLASFNSSRVLVMGDMGELGAKEQSLHQEVGVYARNQGVDRVYCVGNLTRATAKCFGAGAQHFTSKQALIRSLRSELGSDATVLVKGSFFMAMDEVINAIVK